MRIIALTVFLALMIQGCGSDEESTGACADSPVVGTYDGESLGNADVMTINADCSISSTYCVAEGTLEDTGTSTSGNITVTISDTAGKTGCLPLGDTTCGFSLSNDVLEFSCTAGTLTYTKR
jgi:hypothetical protein